MFLPLSLRIDTVVKVVVDVAHAGDARSEASTWGAAAVNGLLLLQNALVGLRFVSRWLVDEWMNEWINQLKKYESDLAVAVDVDFALVSGMDGRVRSWRVHGSTNQEQVATSLTVDL